MSEVEDRVAAHTGILTWVCSVDGRLDQVGPAWRRFTGHDPGGGRSADWSALIHPEDRAVHLRRSADARAAGRGWHSRYRLRRADGVFRWMLEEAVPIEDGWACTAVDLTEHVRSEAMFRLLAEHADDVLGRHTTDGTWLWASPSAQAVAGHRPEDLVGRHPRDLVHPDDDAALTAALTALADDAPTAAPPAELTLRLRGADGGHRWFAVHARRVRDPDTGDVEVHTTARDVTDRLHARDELSRLRGLADRAADFIGIADADGTGLYVNPAGREMIGMPRDRPVHEFTMADYIAPADRRRFAGVVDEVRRTGSWAGPMRFVDSAGTVVPVWHALVVHRDTGGLPAYFSVVAQDLRERRGGEPALQQERERYRSLVAQAPVGIWVGDGEGATTFVNEHMAQLTGLAAGELSGAAWELLVHPEDRAAVVASWAAAVRDGSAWEREYRMRDAHGRDRIVTSAARPLRDGADGVTGFLGTTVDVTAQRTAERTRRVADTEHAARAVSDAAAARLRAMVDGLAAMVWEADWDAERETLRFTFVSDRAQELLGFPASHWLDDPDFWAGLIHPDDRADAVAYVTARTSRGLDHDLTYRACAQGGRMVWLHQVVHVVRDTLGTPLRAQGLTVDVTEQKRAERSTELLAETGRLLADDGGVEQRLSALVRLVAHDFGDAAMVSLSGPDGLLRRAAVAHDDPQVERTLLRLVPTVLSAATVAALAPGLPVVLPAADVPGAQSQLAVPLRIEGRFAGVLSFLHLDSVPYHDAADVELAAELGRRASLMLEADRRRTRERHVQQVTADLASAAGVEEAARRLVTRLRDILGAAAVRMYVVEPDHGTLRMVHGIGYSEELLGRDAVIRHDDDVPLARAVRTGASIWVRDRAEWDRHWPDLPRAVDGAGHGAAALPLRAAGAVVGVVGMSFATDRAFPPDEQRFVLAMAAQAAPALERAAAADERRMIAETLQTSLLPPTLPTLERLALAARYLPGAHGTRAGGDWYDVLPLDDDRVAIAVGDVVGQGARAAAVMGQLRSALSAYLLEGHGPVPALERLDRFAGRVPGAVGSTVTCLVLDTATGELTWARAGHPPPLVAGPGGARFLEDATGTVLGVRGRPPYVAGQTRLAPGDSVVLYTDGLVERRGELVDDGLERLRTAGGRGHRLPPTALAEVLLAGGLGGDAPAGGTGGTDDVALMVARLLPPPLQIDTPAQGHRLRAVRELITAWTVAVGFDADEAYDLQLAVGEAAANAAEHAYPEGSPGRMRIDLGIDTAHGDGTRIAVRVRDEGRWRPERADPGHRGRGLDLIRAIGEDVRLEPGPGGTEIRFGVLATPRTAPPDAPPAEPPAALPPSAGPTVLRTTQTGGVDRVAVVGDLDLDGAASVRSALLAAARAEGADLVLDLRATTYLSSAGMALIVEIEGAARTAGRALRLVAHPGGVVTRALELSGVDRLTALTTR